jgi:hypothetical protein
MGIITKFTIAGGEVAVVCLPKAYILQSYFLTTDKWLTHALHKLIGLWTSSAAEHSRNEALF